jgi:hypothetical protein
MRCLSVMPFLFRALRPFSAGASDAWTPTCWRSLTTDNSGETIHWPRKGRRRFRRLSYCLVGFDLRLIAIVASAKVDHRVCFEIVLKSRNGKSRHGIDHHELP